MWITAREACRALALAGVSQRCALRVLGAGLAGGAMRTSNAVLYDKARVIELAQRPTVSWTELDEPCPAGFFVSRREFPATASRERQLASLCSGWGSVCPWNWVCLDHQIGRYGSFPFVATVGGLVVVGADITRVRGFSTLVLGPPGPWFELLEGCWFPTGRGRPWLLQLGPLTPAVGGT